MNPKIYKSTTPWNDGDTSYYIYKEYNHSLPDWVLFSPKFKIKAKLYNFVNKLHWMNKIKNI
jgi:hypothetical protein